MTKHTLKRKQYYCIAVYLFMLSGTDLRGVDGNAGTILFKLYGKK